MTQPHEPFRLDPQGPVHAYKTYALSSPLTSHTRVATCEEVDCLNYANGWKTVLDVSTGHGQEASRYIAHHSGRRYRAVQQGDTITFYFPPGQQCFTEHRLPLHREPLYVVRGGDWRGNPTGERMKHVRAADWVEDFALHQQRVADQHEKG